MITYRTGDILQSAADVLVNPVNCEGAMGAGLAKKFKQKFPEVFDLYQKDCRDGLYQPGRVIWYEVERNKRKFHIACFPTKDRWAMPSKMEYIEGGLRVLIDQIKTAALAAAFWDTRPVFWASIPMLGCGLGGLPWSQVHERIVAAHDAVDWEGEPVLQLYGEKPEAP